MAHFGAAKCGHTYQDSDTWVNRIYLSTLWFVVVAPGNTSSNKKLLVTKGIATRSKEATRGAPGFNIVAPLPIRKKVTSHVSVTSLTDPLGSTPV